MSELLQSEVAHAGQEETSRPQPRTGKPGDFEKLTITMPPDMVDSLESIRRQRKRSKSGNADLSSIIREAVAFWLQQSVK